METFQENEDSNEPKEEIELQPQEEQEEQETEQEPAVNTWKNLREIKKRNMLKAQQARAEKQRLATKQKKLKELEELKRSFDAEQTPAVETIVIKRPPLPKSKPVPIVRNDDKILKRLEEAEKKLQQYQQQKVEKPLPVEEKAKPPSNPFASYFNSKMMLFN
jgi:hypothetical protein